MTITLNPSTITGVLASRNITSNVIGVKNITSLTVDLMML